MRAVDTNILVRLLARDDARQLAIAESYIRNRVWVSTLALAETIWVMRDLYGRSPAALMNAIEMLLQNADLVIQDSDAVTAALKLFRARPALGFSDCLILELARKAGHLPFGTFDRKLAQVEGTERL